MLTIITSCIKKEESSLTDGFPRITRVWQVNFKFADEDGFNLLPLPLPNNPIVNPDNFYAYYLRNGVPIIRKENYTYSYNTRDGYVFYLGELVDSLTLSDSFKNDSTIVFYACFGNICDTVKVYPNFSCHHDSVLWNNNLLGYYWNEFNNTALIINSDTLKEYNCHVVPLRPSFSNLFKP